MKVIVLLSIASHLYGQQVHIQPPLFAPFECTEFYKLYTGMVMNFTDETVSTRLKLEVDYTSPSGNSFRLADGILSGNPSVDFRSGTTLINNATYENIYSNRQITFYDKGIEDLLSRTKCLPPGTYEVCLTLFDVNAAPNASDFVSQTCYVREKEMQSRLLLVSPFEEEEIKIQLPLFTWTAITPVTPRAYYRIQMVELLANQTPFEAFRSNPIFYERQGLFSNIFQYPVAARTMLPCTDYAWRVTYELEGRFNVSSRAPNYLQQSEIWTFHMPCDEEEEEEEEEIDQNLPKYYYKPSINQASNYYNHTEPILRIEVDNSYAQGTLLSYRIEDHEGRESSTNCCPISRYCNDCKENKKSINQDGLLKGKNLLFIELSELGLEKGRYYRIILEGLKQNMFINFKLNENDE